MSNILTTNVRKMENREFNKLSLFIEDEVGIKLPPSKRLLVESRLQKRLKAHNISDFSDYCEFVFKTEKGKIEIIELIDAITTNKTDFLREPTHFEYMIHSALPDLARNRKELRLWSAACSSGQEPYNMAMFMEEYIEKAGSLKYEVTATDISRSSLEKARRAVYNKRDIEIVSQKFKKKYFLKSRDPQNDDVRIKSGIRKKVIFKSINLMKDDYGLNETFDIVFCRNVLIYFSKENQEYVINRIVNHMNSGAYLFLGHSESLAGIRQQLVNVSASVYRKE